MTHEQIQSYTFRVSQANKTEMIVILYDIALTYIDSCEAALRADQKREFRKNIDSLRRTINELTASVNTSTELGMTLLRLYIFCGGEITKAYMDYNPHNLENIRKDMTKLRDAYKVASSKDTSPAVMQNTEKVYSGFTYSHTGVSENVASVDAGRGYLA